MNETLRRILAQHGKLAVDAASLGETDDLYAAGLTSFATVQLMLAIEDAFDIEIPDRLLNRRTFASLAALESCVAGLVGEKEPA
ncbi:MAG: acyl carrier protein [Methylobacteriaceae bacterium]|nr:acyl carrier protein [Methylobacteriaceae bacterium]